MMMMVIFEAIAFLIFINVLCRLSFFDFISKIDFLLQTEMTVSLWNTWHTQDIYAIIDSSMISLVTRWYQISGPL